MAIPLAQRHLPINAALQNGKYHILDILGQGGFGITYLAKHQIFGEVALKELFLSSGSAQCSRENTTQKNVIAHFDVAQFNNFKDRFLEEAKTLYKLKDVKGVVKVLDIFEENSTVYFSMEYLDGDKLEDYVKKRKKLSEKEGLAIIQSIGRTLADIHKRGVLHRDIKPANIIVGENGETTLIDFGIARNYVDEVTETHTTFHSPRFSPPEQKIAKSRMGDYSDVYSLGATAYFIFTGEQPQSLEERITGEYVPPQVYAPNLPDSINDAITKSLNIKERERFQKVEDFLYALTHESQRLPPQYSAIPPEEIAKIVAPSVKDDVTQIEPLKPVQDDVTQIEPLKHTQDDITTIEPQVTGKIIVEDDKTLLEKSPIIPNKNIVADDKTRLEPVESTIIDDDKTLILDKDNKTKTPFDWKAWLKTRDGRIIGGALILTVFGVLISSIISTCSRTTPKPNNYTIVPLTPQPTDSSASIVQNPVSMPMQDAVKKDTIQTVIPPVALPKKPNKKAGAAQPDTYEPNKPEVQTTKPLPTEEPKLFILKDFCKSMSTLPVSGVWRHNNSNIILCDELSCNINGKNGTFRLNDANDKIMLVCAMNGGKYYDLIYDKKSRTLEFDGKKFIK